MSSRFPPVLSGAGLALLSLLAVSCGPPAARFDRREMLRDLTANVILPTYRDLAERTAELETATVAHCPGGLWEHRRCNSVRDADRATLSRSGHILKGQEMRTALRRLIRSGDLDEADTRIARHILGDLQRALSGL